VIVGGDVEEAPQTVGELERQRLQGQIDGQGPEVRRVGTRVGGSHRFAEVHPARRRTQQRRAAS